MYNLISMLVMGGVITYKVFAELLKYIKKNFFNAEMAQQMDDVILLCYKIAERCEIRNTRKNSIIGMTIAAVGVLACGLLFGPPGIVVGGLFGGLLGWLLTRGQFKSVPQILMELPHAEKQELCDAVVAVLGNMTWTDAPQLIAIVMDDDALQQVVTAVLNNYIKKKV